MKQHCDWWWLILGLALLGSTFWLLAAYPIAYWIVSLIGAGILEVVGYRRGFKAGRQSEIDRIERRRLGVIGYDD